MVIILQYILIVKHYRTYVQLTLTSQLKKKGLHQIQVTKEKCQNLLNAYYVLDTLFFLPLRQVL